MTSNPPLSDVITYLTSTEAGLGLTFGTNFFASLMPDTPNQVVVVDEFAGPAPDWVFSEPLPGIEETHYQIISRDVEANYAANQTTIQNIYRVVTAVAGVQIGGTNYLWWEPLHPPAFMGRDQNRRILHVLNFAAMRQPN